MENSDPLLKMADVAERLAISKPSAYNLCLDGKLTCYHFGRCVRVKESDLVAFMERARSDDPPPA